MSGTFKVIADILSMILQPVSAPLKKADLLTVAHCLVAAAIE